jgi:hypothetical protein
MGIDKTAVIDLVEYSELAPTRGKNRSIYKPLYPLTIASQDLVVRMHGSTRHLGWCVRSAMLSSISHRPHDISPGDFLPQRTEND